MGHVGVLFIQSQQFFGADSQIHASIMRHLSRERYEVHCAIPDARHGQPSDAAIAIGRIPSVRLRPTDFGPSFESVPRPEAMRMLARRGVPTIWSLLGLVRYVRRHNIRVLHCTEKPRDAVFGLLVAKLAGARCVIHVHVKAELWIRSSVRRAMHHADALIGVSRFVAQSIRYLGYDPSRVEAVLNGLEIEDWDEHGVDTAAIRSEFDIAADAPVIVSASRLFRFKGQHELLAALPEVVRRHPDVRTLIVGADDPRAYSGEERYSDVLRAICDEHDLWDHVIFTGWRSDVRSLMATCDVYAMPSFEEPFGMVFTEAMYLRRPVVALDNGGTPEVVEHERSGLLSRPGDVGAIAANVGRLLDSRELRERMGESGRQRVIDVLNSERMARDVELVYERLIG